MGCYKLNTSKALTLSYSSLGLLNSCPRKFELYKYHPLTSVEVPRDETPALVQGKAVGIGLATYLETRSLEAAVFQTWLNYYPRLEDNVRDQTKAIRIVETLIKCPLIAGGRYSLAKLNDKPCVETSFCIKISKTLPIYFVGFLDGILTDNNDPTGQTLVPLELKTSSLAANLECVYKNSAQGNGYGLILDKISGTLGKTYDIQYLIAQVKRTKAEQYSPEIHLLKFKKTIVDRLEWLMDIKLQLQRIETYNAVGLFPKDGSSCLAWNRPCKFFDLCNLSGSAGPLGDKDREDKATDVWMEYDYYFELDDLINDALQIVKTEQGE